jgi:hypothetical protein
MTKRPKQSKKGTKHSKRTKDAVQPEEEPDTATTFLPAETPESIPVSPQTEAAEVPVESLQAAEVAAPAIQSTESEAAPKITRSDAAKANIKEGLRQHQIAGRPTKAQLVLVFGKAGIYLLGPSVQKGSASHQKLSKLLWQRVFLLCRSPLSPSLLWRKQKGRREAPLRPWSCSRYPRCPGSNRDIGRRPF